MCLELDRNETFVQSDRCRWETLGELRRTLRGGNVSLPEVQRRLSFFVNENWKPHASGGSAVRIPDAPQRRKRTPTRPLTGRRPS